MNFYLKTPPYALVFGLFAAKWSAFWCKTECVLVLNGVRFGAKWSVFCCKTQGVLVLNAVHFGAKRGAKCCKMRDEKHKNTLQWYKQNLSESLKSRLKGAK